MMIARLALASLVTASALAASPFNAQPVQTKNTRKAALLSKVLNHARRLDEGDDAELDLTSYSLKYEKCQFIKSYSDDLAEDEDSETVFLTNRFVIFKLCPSSSCSYNYGEYLVDMDTYLQMAVEYQQEEQENMCKYCEEVCVAEDDAVDEAEEGEEEEEEGEDGDRKLRRRKLADLMVDCDTCGDTCEKIENMEDNGYVEASNFIECQQVGAADDGTEYFAGALCANDGLKIKIGVFLDDQCSQVDSSLDVEDFIGAKLSHALLKNIYNTESLTPCVKSDWEVPEDDDANANDEEKEVEANEMCNELYEASAKCESKHGFQDSLSDDEEYYNQYAQEDLVCSFIDTIGNGAYDEYGEIVLKSKSTNVEGATETTGGQKFALTVFIIGSIGLAVYAAQLHSSLTKKGSAGLSDQGGAMA